MASGMEIAIPAAADLIKAGIKPALNPRLMATITKEIGTEIITAARHENTVL